MRTGGLACLLVAGAGAMAADVPMPPLTVVQQGRAFVGSDLVIAPGRSIRFVNNDDYDHQVSVVSQSHVFDSDIIEAGDSVVVQFVEPGTYQIRCRLHPRMQLTVTVR